MKKINNYFNNLRNRSTKVNFSTMVISSIFIAVAIFLFPMMIDLWIENDSETSVLYNWVSRFTQINLNIIWVLIIFGFVVIVLYQIYRGYSVKTNEYEQYKRDQARTILGLYDELNHFDLQKNIKIIMEKFSKYHQEIIAVQLYKYEESSKRNKVITKVNYMNGYVKESNVINGIIQQYYDIDKKLYKRYFNAVTSFEENTENIEILLDFILSEVEKINNKPLRNIDEEDASKYALIIDAYGRIKRYYPESDDIYIEEDTKTNRLQRLLAKKKRFGIYRGILLGSFYSFYYEGGEGSKKGRQYITNPIILKDEKYLILITLDSDLIINFKEERLEEYIIEFERMILETFDRVYNKEKGEL